MNQLTDINASVEVNRKEICILQIQRDKVKIFKTGMRALWFMILTLTYMRVSLIIKEQIIKIRKQKFRIPKKRRIDS